MAKRIERWHRFRSHIALRTKFQFQYHLSKRDYWGTIVFDHERLTLDLKVSFYLLFHSIVLKYKKILASVYR